ncbi:hypothetical protein DW084_06290 [Enterococcus casseliflavus]|uniref:Uncharacterized protein n=1 Tax=Enterococcus casseliflavus TaxID=37734 RepID=A0A415EUX8_ENTCA|nr:hypothetical protein DW084_06290 [Enterococcus casseliflavus]
MKELLSQTKDSFWILSIYHEKIFYCFSNKRNPISFSQISLRAGPIFRFLLSFFSQNQNLGHFAFSLFSD